MLHSLVDSAVFHECKVIIFGINSLLLRRILITENEAQIFMFPTLKRRLTQILTDRGNNNLRKFALICVS